MCRCHEREARNVQVVMTRGQECTGVMRSQECTGKLREATFFIIHSVQFTSVQFKMVSMQSGKAHMRSTPSLRSFPNVALETVPMLV